MPKKLTIEEVRYIDMALLKAGIRYADIRIEMTDHVASVLEEKDGDFHQNFSLYLSHHQTELTESYGMYRKQAFNRAIGFIAKQLCILWIIIPLVMMGCFGLTRITDAETVSFCLYMINAITASVVFYYLWYYRVYKKHVYSVFEKLLFIILVSGMTFRISNFNNGSLWSLAYFSFGTAFLLMLLISGIKLNCYYKTRYAA